MFRREFNTREKVGLVAFPILSLVTFLSARSLMSKKKNARERVMSGGSRIMAAGPLSDNKNGVPPIVNILIYLDKMPDRDQVIEYMTRATIEFPRMRSYMVNDGGQWKFVELDFVNMAEHIFYSTINTEADLLRYIDKLISFDPEFGDKPCWNMYIISIKDSQKVACLTRIHHVIGDGASLMAMMAEVMTMKDGKPLTTIPANCYIPAKKEQLSNLTSSWRALRSLLSIISLPASSYDTDVWLAPISRKTMKMDPPAHRTIHLPALKLEFVKALKSAGGVTVNDVMLSLTAGMYRRYYNYQATQKPEKSSKRKLRNRVLMHMAVPNSCDHGELHNNSIVVSTQICTDMKVSCDAAKERLLECHRRSSARKNSIIPAVCNWLQSQLTAHLPLWVIRLATNRVYKRHTAIFSSVAGPTQAAYFAGAKVLSICPISLSLIDHASVMTYDDTVFYNINVDTNQCPDADKLAAFYFEECLELARELRSNMPAGPRDSLFVVDALAPMCPQAGLALGMSNEIKSPYASGKGRFTSPLRKSPGE